MSKATRVLGWPASVLAVALALVLMMPIAPPAYADEATFYLECPDTEVREGESVDVYLVRITNHQHDATFGAMWHTEAGTADSDDYVHRNTEAIWADDVDAAANRTAFTLQTKEDSLVEDNETFTIRFTPVDNVVDRNDPDRDEKCDLTIIDDDLKITGVAVTSSPARGDTYGVGETIEISATFSAAVDVNGSPGLGMWVGGNWRSAHYLRGSGSDTLVFGYTVQADDSDTDGIKMDGGYKDREGRWHNFLSHTAVTAVGTETVALRAYSGFDDQSGHKVDGAKAPYGTGTAITSSPASGNTYRKGETIEFSITFNLPLDMAGSRHLNLYIGPGDASGWRGATYKRGSGTKTLVFEYTVEPADFDDNGIKMLGTWTENGEVKGLGGSGTIKVKGTNAVVTPTFSGLSDQSGHSVDGRPYPVRFAITSTPAARSDTYGRGEVIQLSVTFDQSVAIDGGAENSFGILRIGSAWTQGHAAYSSGSGTDTLVFECTVLEGDRDDNGIDAYLPHDMPIRAAGTQIAFLPNAGGETPTMGEDANHKVDGSLVAAPTTASGD